VGGRSRAGRWLTGLAGWTGPCMAPGRANPGQGAGGLSARRDPAAKILSLE